MKNTGAIIACAFALALAACTTVSDVTQIGKDTYMVGVEQRGGLNSKTQVTQIAIKRAASFCTSQGKNLSLDHVSDSGIRGWTPVDSQITFMCLASDDPAYGRLKFKNDANVVIDVNQK